MKNLSLVSLNVHSTEGRIFVKKFKQTNVFKVFMSLAYIFKTVKATKINVRWYHVKFVF